MKKLKSKICGGYRRYFEKNSITTIGCKKTCLILALILISVSCEHNLMTRVMDNFIYSELENIEYYDFEEYRLPEGVDIWEYGYFNCIEGINSFKGIAQWIEHNIDYIPDVAGKFYSPEQTLKRGGGDCEDYAILFLNLAHKVLGETGSLVVVNTNDVGRTIVEGGAIDHAIVMFNGELISAFTGRVYDDVPIRYIYSFEEVF